MLDVVFVGALLLLAVIFGASIQWASRVIGEENHPR